MTTDGTEFDIPVELETDLDFGPVKKREPTEQERRFDLLLDRLRGLKEFERFTRVNSNGLFNMNFVVYECGSPACIAGHALDLAKTHGLKGIGPNDFSALSWFLGIPTHDADYLLCGRFGKDPDGHIPVEEAIEAVEKMREKYCGPRR